MTTINILCDKENTTIYKIIVAYSYILSSFFKKKILIFSPYIHSKYKGKIYSGVISDDGKQEHDKSMFDYDIVINSGTNARFYTYIIDLNLCDNLKDIDLKIKNNLKGKKKFSILLVNYENKIVIYSELIKKYTLIPIFAIDKNTIKLIDFKKSSNCHLPLETWKKNIAKTLGLSM
jgi:hypothetical protein